MPGYSCLNRNNSPGNVKREKRDSLAGMESL